MKSREEIVGAANCLEGLGFKKIVVEDDNLEEVKRGMPRNSFILIEDCTEAPGWTQDFVILVARGRNGKVMEFRWFGPKMVVY